LQNIAVVRGNPPVSVAFVVKQNFAAPVSIEIANPE
jgi:hypothetical protein